jgi:uncharacterized membrane protein
MSGILVGIVLAIIDILCFGFCKYIFINKLSLWWLLLPSIAYGAQIYIFYYGLQTNSISVLNIIWNLFSSIFVTIIGVLYFKEVLSIYQNIAIVLGIISILLFSL